jgi:flagellar M-ring protein FliF
MEQIKARWGALSRKQKIIAGAGAGVSLALAAGMLAMTGSEEEALLYAGLDPVAAGEVIAALDKDSVPYTVRGGSIHVARDQRDALRLSLAARNLPRPAAEGYELLDRLDGFSTTSDMFSVTYWRAKEGELARTMMTIPGITVARVHIGIDERRGFASRREGRTASVTITAPSGLDQGQVKAVRYLTALAIPGLSASEVAVVETSMGLLSEADELGTAAGGRQADQLEADLTRLLEARVGPGNARVNVAVDVSHEREEVAEHLVDPETAVVINAKRETARSREEGSEGAVTIASDLPDGEAATNDRAAEEEETREETAYAVSTTDRRVERLPGAVRRISVAALINEVPGSERSAEEMETLRTLLSAAAGLDPERGDVLTVTAMPFGQVPALPEPQVPWYTGLPLASLIQTGILGLSALLFGLFVVRPLFSGRGTDDVLAAELVSETSGALPAPSHDGFAQDPVRLLTDRSAANVDKAGTLLNAWLDDKENNAA